MRLSLVKAGVPFDVAFALPDGDALAYSVVMGELEGGHIFSWETMSWRKRGQHE